MVEINSPFSPVEYSFFEEMAHSAEEAIHTKPISVNKFPSFENIFSVFCIPRHWFSL